MIIEKYNHKIEFETTGNTLPPGSTGQSCNIPTNWFRINNCKWIPYDDRDFDHFRRQEMFETENKNIFYNLLGTLQNIMVRYNVNTIEKFGYIVEFETTATTNPPGVYGMAGQAFTDWYRINRGSWKHVPISFIYHGQIDMSLTEDEELFKSLLHKLEND